MEKKTMEEAAEEYLMNIHTKGYGNIVNAFIAGAEWYAKNQSDQMYSEEEVLAILNKRDKHNMDNPDTLNGWQTPKEWLNLNKKS